MRIKWIFMDKPDVRSDLEKKFYKASDWEPPRACVEIENMISRMQEYFDKWKPPRRVKDNLSKQERTFVKELKEKNDLIYMWEYKGSSFVKMTKD